MIDAEEFGAWRANPVTEAVFTALKAKGAEARAMWMRASWDNGNIDPLLLADLRARAEIAEDIAALTFDELETILNAQSES